MCPGEGEVFEEQEKENKPRSHYRHNDKQKLLSIPLSPFQFRSIILARNCSNRIFATHHITKGFSHCRLAFVISWIYRDILQTRKLSILSSSECIQSTDSCVNSFSVTAMQTYLFAI